MEDGVKVEFRLCSSGEWSEYSQGGSWVVRELEKHYGISSLGPVDFRITHDNGQVDLYIFNKESGTWTKQEGEKKMKWFEAVAEMAKGKICQRPRELNKDEFIEFKVTDGLLYCRNKNNQWRRASLDSIEQLSDWSICPEYKEMSGSEFIEWAKGRPLSTEFEFLYGGASKWVMATLDFALLIQAALNGKFRVRTDQ